MAKVIQGGLVGPTRAQSIQQNMQAMGQGLQSFGNELARRREVADTNREDLRRNWLDDFNKELTVNYGGDITSMAQENLDKVYEYFLMTNNGNVEQAKADTSRVYSGQMTPGQYQAKAGSDVLRGDLATIETQIATPDLDEATKAQLQSVAQELQEKIKQTEQDFATQNAGSNPWSTGDPTGYESAYSTIFGGNKRDLEGIRTGRQELMQDFQNREDEIYNSMNRPTKVGDSGSAPTFAQGTMGQGPSSVPGMQAYDQATNGQDPHHLAVVGEAEGIINAQAMSQPGVADMVKRLNDQFPNPAADLAPDSIPTFADGNSPRGASSTGVDYKAQNEAIMRPDLDDFEMRMARSYANPETIGHSMTQAQTALGLNSEAGGAFRGRQQAIDELTDLYGSGRRPSTDYLKDMAQRYGLDPELVTKRAANMGDEAQSYIASRLMREGMSSNIASGRAARIWQEARDMGGKLLRSPGAKKAATVVGPALAGVGRVMASEGTGLVGDVLSGTPPGAPGSLGGFGMGANEMAQYQDWKAMMEERRRVNTTRPESGPFNWGVGKGEDRSYLLPWQEGGYSPNLEQYAKGKSPRVYADGWPSYISEPVAHEQASREATRRANEAVQYGQDVRSLEQNAYNNTPESQRYWDDEGNYIGPVGKPGTEILPAGEVDLSKYDVVLDSEGNPDTVYKEGEYQIVVVPKKDVPDATTTETSEKLLPDFSRYEDMPTDVKAKVEEADNAVIAPAPPTPPETTEDGEAPAPPVKEESPLTRGQFAKARKWVSNRPLTGTFNRNVAGNFMNTFYPEGMDVLDFMGDVYRAEELRQGKESLNQAAKRIGLDEDRINLTRDAQNEAIRQFNAAHALDKDKFNTESSYNDSILAMKEAAANVDPAIMDNLENLQSAFDDDLQRYIDEANGNVDVGKKAFVDNLIATGQDKAYEDLMNSMFEALGLAPTFSLKDVPEGETAYTLFSSGRAFLNRVFFQRLAEGTERGQARREERQENATPEGMIPFSGSTSMDYATSPQATVDWLNAETSFGYE